MGSGFETAHLRQVAAIRLVSQLHQIGNTLAALRLRLDLVTNDSTCRWAQADNLLAMGALLREAARMVAEVEVQLRAD
jgi:hypothetical protein